MAQLKASKYLTYSLLLDPSEMAQLMATLPDHTLYNVSEVADHVELSHLQFLSHYATYFEKLHAGDPPHTREARPYFTAALSATRDAFAITETDRGFLTQANHPVIQMRAHSYTYSDGKFHSMVHGEASRPWGIAFSFPQIYEASSGEIVEVYKDKNHPNTMLFRALATWVKNNTKPMSFMIDGQKKTATFRIGKRCHPPCLSN